MDQRVDVLRGAPLFEGLPMDAVLRFLEQGRPRRFDRGEVVFHEGDPGDSLHLIATGRFAARTATRQGDVATLAVFGPGDLFGEIALIRPDAKRTATIGALERGETLSIHRHDLDTLRGQHPEVNDVLLRILAGKVERYTRHLLEALYVPAEVRVLRRLVELRDIYADADIPVTQASLATMAGTSRSTVNKVLGEEVDRGTLRLTRGRVIVLHRDALEHRAR
jgi:CRP-like cAMP-binding protein